MPSAVSRILDSFAVVPGTTRDVKRSLSADRAEVFCSPLLLQLCDSAPYGYDTHQRVRSRQGQEAVVTSHRKVVDIQVHDADGYHGLILTIP